MTGLYLTPASLTYLIGFILSLLLAVHFCFQLRAPQYRTVQKISETGFLVFITIYIGLLFLGTALVFRARLTAIYLNSVFLTAALIFLIQVAYHFPESRMRYKNEARIVFYISIFYLVFEFFVAAYRFYHLSNGNVIERPLALYYLTALAFTFAIFLFLRQAIYTARASEPSLGNLSALLNLDDHQSRLVRAIVLVYILPFLVFLIGAFALRFSVSYQFFQMFVSLGVLATLFVAFVSYFTYQPERTSFRYKITGISLLISSLVLGLAGWLIVPVYSSFFSPEIPSRQMFRFTPNSKGAYNVSEVPFQFDREWGERLDIQDSSGDLDSAALDFVFPFYGKLHYKIFVSEDGVLGLGRGVSSQDIQNNRLTSPAIFPLYFDMTPTPGGVYTRQDAESLLITWDVRSAYQPEVKFNFQTRLYTDGVFDIAYNEAPAAMRFIPDEIPETSVYLIGIIRGDSVLPPEILPQSLWDDGGATGFVHDYYLAFREYQHRILVPFFYLIVLNTLLMLFGLPLFIARNILHPLRDLLAGFKKADAGDFSAETPARYEDEFGMMSASLNKMATRLLLYSTKLEDLVADRTEQLQAANELLRSEITEHKSSEVRVTQQQRKLVAAEEREQMVRYLQDSFGQLIGYINVQAQAVQALLNKNQAEAAHENLQLLVHAAQNAHSDLRSYILGLRDADQHHHNFYESLRTYLTAFGRAWDIETVFSMPHDTLPFLPDTVEDQLLHIVQEALANIRKHANARRVEVLMTFSPGEIVLIISDDGRGFDLQTVWNIDSKHLGLRIMRERAEQIGGRLELRSNAGRGTQVVAHIPRIFASAQNEHVPNELLNLRILLVDDQPLFLEGMRNLLTSRGLTVIGVARDGFQALDQVRALRPDVVLMDVLMPVCNGIEATRLIKHEFPDVKIALLSVSENEGHLVEAIKYGISGYFLKGMDMNDLFALLSRMIRDEVSVPPAMLSRLMTQIPRPEDAPDGSGETAAELTSRQWEILQLVAKGLTYKEVAKLLHVSEVTIKYHMGQIVDRLHLKNREQAVAYALRVISK
jgi:two-component system NarL family response regulator